MCSGRATSTPQTSGSRFDAGVRTFTGLASRHHKLMTRGPDNHQGARCLADKFFRRAAEQQAGQAGAFGLIVDKAESQES